MTDILFWTIQALAWAGLGATIYALDGLSWQSFGIFIMGACCGGTMVLYALGAVAR